MDVGAAVEELYADPRDLVALESSAKPIHRGTGSQRCLALSIQWIRSIRACFRSRLVRRGRFEIHAHETFVARRENFAKGAKREGGFAFVRRPRWEETRGR